VTIDDSLAEAHVSLAFATMHLDWDWKEAESRLLRGIQLNPRYAFGYHVYAHLLAMLGRDEQALARYEEALEIDPLSPHHMTCLAAHCIHLDRFDEAERWCLKALELDPDSGPGHYYLGWTYVRTGRLPEAIAEFKKDLPLCEASLAHAYGVAGRTTAARKIINQWLEDSKTEFTASVDIALMYAGLREQDQTLTWLERAYQTRDSGLLPFIGVEPAFEHLHGNPRFDDLLRRTGLEPDDEGRTGQPFGGKITLAVLPFEDLGGDADARFLADEIPASIIQTLWALSGLQVIPRSTAFRYKVEDRDTATIGRDLSATAVLTGQINSRGDTLIIRTELVDVASNTQLWDERYNRELADILAIEEDIAKEISEALQLQLTGEERAQLTRRYTDNAEAYQHYLEGRFWWNKATEEALYRAIKSFDRAIAVDPDYALAYAGKADAYGILVAYRPPAEEVIPKARAAVEKALSLDNELAEAHTAAGWIRYVYDWDWSASDAAFNRALEIDPGYAFAHRLYAHLLAGHDYKRAIEHAERARQLDPGSLIVNTCLGHFYSWAGRNDTAIKQLRDTIAMDPSFGIAHVYLAEALLNEREYDEAIEEFREAHKLAGYIAYAAGGLGHAYAMAGLREDALQELENLRALSEQGTFVPNSAYARIHVGLGNVDEALRWLNKGCDAREVWMPYVKHQPYFRTLRGDPRFDNILRRIGLPLPTPGDPEASTAPHGSDSLDTHD
jgi:serine/threonine-protein kinase